MFIDDSDAFFRPNTQHNRFTRDYKGPIVEKFGILQSSGKMFLDIEWIILVSFESYRISVVL